MEKIRVHVFISGEVQGVNFRYYTCEFAKKLGLKGWVRNLFDGRVEVIAEGEKNRIDELIQFLRKGPSLARVDKIEVKEEKYKGEFENFSIRY